MKMIYKIILGLSLVWVFSFLLCLLNGHWTIVPTLITGVVLLVCIVFWEGLWD